MKQFLIFCVLSSCNLNTFSQKKIMYDFPGGSLSSDVICGRAKVCVCGTGGEDNNLRIYKFAKNPFSPTVNSTSTIKSAAASVLGQTVGWDMNAAEDKLPCKSLKILPEDVEFAGDSIGYTFKYKLQRNFKIDIKAAIEADIKELIGSASIEQTLIDSLKAGLEAGYRSANEKKLEIDGRYLELTINDNLLAEIRTDDKYKACRDFLQQDQRALITHISLVVFNLSRNVNVDRKLFADLEAKLIREGIKVDLEAVIENKIISNLESTVKNRYAIVAWAKRKTY